VKKRIGLIMAREVKGLTKKQVALGSQIDCQRYQRIESDANVKIDIEEAYRVANFLGYKHPDDIFLPIGVEKIDNSGRKAG